MDLVHSHWKIKTHWTKLSICGKISMQNKHEWGVEGKAGVPGASDDASFQCSESPLITNKALLRHTVRADTDYKYRLWLSICESGHFILFNLYWTNSMRSERLVWLVVSSDSLFLVLSYKCKTKVCPDHHFECIKCFKNNRPFSAQLLHTDPVL